MSSLTSVISKDLRDRTEHELRERAAQLDDSVKSGVKQARTAIVTDVLPTVTSRAASLASDVAKSAQRAAKNAHEAADQAEINAEKFMKRNKPVKKHKRSRRLLIVLGTAGFVAAATIMYRRNRTPVEDPWATPVYTPPTDSGHVGHQSPDHDHDSDEAAEEQPNNS